MVLTHFNTFNSFSCFTSINTFYSINSRYGGYDRRLEWSVRCVVPYTLGMADCGSGGLTLKNN